jgi:hypothetical protein
MTAQVSVAIVGAQKSGTTSLLRYISQHPQLTGHGPIECAYFADDGEWARGWEAAHARYFYGAQGDRLVAKSATLYAKPVGLERLATHNPHCDVILILRDPVERAFSSYRMERNTGWIDRPFDHVLDVLDTPGDAWHRLFIEYGEYAPAVRRIHQLFDPRRLQVLLYEEFVADPRGTCRQVFERLGVEPDFTPDTTVAHNAHQAVSSKAMASALVWLRRPNNPAKRMVKRLLPPQAFDTLGERVLDVNRAGSQQEEMSTEVRLGLEAHYRSLNLELETLLGRDLSCWAGMTPAGARAG